MNYLAAAKDFKKFGSLTFVRNVDMCAVIDDNLLGEISSACTATAIILYYSYNIIYIITLRKLIADKISYCKPKKIFYLAANAVQYLIPF